MKLDIQQQPVFVKYNAGGFRAGQWARIEGVIWAPETFGNAPRPGRACFKVKFIDNVVDYWPIEEQHLMEFTHFITGRPE